MSKRHVWCFCLSLSLVTVAQAQIDIPPVEPFDISNSAQSEQKLEEERGELRVNVDTSAAYVYQLLDFGLWEEASRLLQGTSQKSSELLLAEAWLLFKTHRYTTAQGIIDTLLEENPGHKDAQLLQVYLLIQAWDLGQAASIAEGMLVDSLYADAAIALGKIRLLERDYDAAMDLALQVQAAYPRNAEAHLLEGDVYFWQRDLASAEEALRRSLELDPYSADARFAYGYAIWRRVDATLLDEMAGHWNIGLALDPLNYRLHWHFGNGHTNLTYADYAHSSDSTVRALILDVDSLIAVDEVEQAIAQTRAIEKDYSESVLPAMARASAFFMAYDMDRESRLDSAQFHFLEILARKPNYGPAHNGVAAVIKHRQFSQLKEFDRLDGAIEGVPLSDASDFTTVFPDAGYYPGNRMEKMLQVQLHKGVVYLPFLIRLDRTFKIPPLHVDLAQAMDAPYFRYATTFDNRQWMDIRGVGSGAAGIEYVERGAYLERNVVLHEYVHLFHGTILTDEEQRRIRALYLAAMQEDRVLDYYSANNESEYLAQTYTAYFAPVKVHPLNHKAMNTRRDLEEKDPALFQFIDELVGRQTAYLEGDTLAMASNWAQVYVTLSEQARRGRGPDAVEDSLETYQVAAALLDTALTWDAGYVPAFVSYAALRQEEEKFEEADSWLDRAAFLDSSYAPVFRARAELAQARLASKVLSEAESFENQLFWYERALAVEEDFAERASLNEALRTLYLEFGEVADAIKVADQYVASAPVVSTYLRDRRDEAWVFASTHRSRIGYSSEVLDAFSDLVNRKPQHYAFKLHYADVLARAGQLERAIDVLNGAQRILSAAGRPRTDYAIYLASLHLQVGDSARARTLIESRADARMGADLDELKKVEVLVRLGDTGAATAHLEKFRAPTTPYLKAEHAFVRGLLEAASGKQSGAVDAFKEALTHNAYHVPARLQLISYFVGIGNRDRVADLMEVQGLGPAFYNEASELLGPSE